MDSFIDYTAHLATHNCTRPVDDDGKWCGGSFALRSYPVDDGWVVAVCCTVCRDKRGLPTRYSIESPPFPTFDQAERSRKALLKIRTLPPPKIINPLDFPKERNVIWNRSRQRWRVQVSRNGKRVYRDHTDHAEAVRIRDELEAA